MSVSPTITYDDESRVLELARDWKAGKLTPVHPSVGRVLNRALVAADEDPVPHRRNTSLRAPSVVDLVRREHERAPTVRSRQIPAATRRFLDDMSRSVHRTHT